MKRFTTPVFLVFIFCLLLLTVNITETLAAESHAWTTLQGNEMRTGYTESSGPDSNQTCWKFQTGGPIVSSPVVADGIVFLASTDGNLYAVNVTTGTKIWEFWTGTDVNSPTVANGKVFITSTSGTVYALDMYTGSTVWSQQLGEPAGFGAPLFVGSRLFVNGNQTVFCFNELAGVFLYSEAIPHANGIAPLTYDNSSYDDGLIVSVALRGTEIGLNGFEAKTSYGRFWVALAPSGVEMVRSGATIGDGKTFVVTVGPDDSSTIFGLNDFGMILWDIQLDGVTEASAAFAYNTVYVPTSKTAYAIDPENGTIKWSRQLDGEHSVSSPAVADGKVYFGLDNSYIYALDAFTGDIVWSYKTEGAVQSSPAIYDGLLFVGSSDGNLYAIGASVIPEFPVSTTIIFAATMVAVIVVIFRHKICRPKQGET